MLCTKDDLITYLQPTLVSHFYFPISRPLDHTMGMAIDDWAKDKLPFDSLKTCVEQGIQIQVHGVYPTFFSQLSSHLHFTEVEEILFDHNPSDKLYNCIRPKFFWGKKHLGKKLFLLVAVTPGRDYIFQYAGLLRHGLSVLTRDYAPLLTIYRYPFLEAEIATWSGLNKKRAQSPML